MVRQKKAPAARRRPMSREEALARQERQQRRRELEQESRELAKGPIDLPFFILVMLLSGVGLVMLLSASFPSAYYETDGQNPMSYFIRQGVFAIMGVAAMLFIGKKMCIRDSPSTEHPPRWDLCGRHPGTSRTLSGDRRAADHRAAHLHRPGPGRHRRGAGPSGPLAGPGDADPQQLFGIEGGPCLLYTSRCV